MVPWPGAQASTMRGIPVLQRDTGRQASAPAPDRCAARFWCIKCVHNPESGEAITMQLLVDSVMQKESPFTQITLDAGVLQAVFADGRSLKTSKAW
jgi:hypothetical protein